MFFLRFFYLIAAAALALTALRVLAPDGPVLVVGGAVLLLSALRARSALFFFLDIGAGLALLAAHDTLLPSLVGRGMSDLLGHGDADAAFLVAVAAYGAVRLALLAFEPPRILRPRLA